MKTLGTARYADAEKNAAHLGDMYIPRNHRSWEDSGLDKEEAAGDILPYDYTSTEDLLEHSTQVEQDWVVNELKRIDIQVVFTIERSKRALYTLEDLYTYKEALRDYVQVVKGKLTVINNVRPTLKVKE